MILATLTAKAKANKTPLSAAAVVTFLSAAGVAWDKSGMPMPIFADDLDARIEEVFQRIEYLDCAGAVRDAQSRQFDIKLEVKRHERWKARRNADLLADIAELESALAEFNRLNTEAQGVVNKGCSWVARGGV